MSHKKIRKGMPVLFKKLVSFLSDESGDIAVTWVVVIIICVIIAVTAWKYIGDGVASASKSMGNALSGQ